MLLSFLDVLRQNNELTPDGALNAPAPDAPASDAPVTKPPSEFGFATGIECSNPTIVDAKGWRIRQKMGPVGAAYLQLIKEFEHITPVAHGETFERTERDATVRQDV